MAVNIFTATWGLIVRSTIVVLELIPFLLWVTWLTIKDFGYTVSPLASASQSYIPTSGLVRSICTTEPAHRLRHPCWARRTRRSLAGVHSSRSERFTWPLSWVRRFAYGY